MTICNLKSAICNQAQRGAGVTLEEIFNLTKSDRWCRTQIKGVAGFEGQLAGTRR